MRLGIISPEVLNTLEEKYSDDFIIDKERKSVCLHEKYKTERERTDAFRRLLTDMREKEVFRSFKGWRNECAGGLASGLGVMECAIKECREEASVDDETLKSLRPAGAIQSLIINEEFKPNCAMVTVDFMIRRGLIAPDEGL
ncbi:hypothetical protein MAR_020669 [Mya arenaria]|uniref:DUF4743 domain-containing protein n=1 Tax=Mya arenaria TaxID=6604 RepID=A0ABY7E5J1_MYAAR|nr:hypothetical protein MAR_020669 [Mya arenaria]